MLTSFLKLYAKYRTAQLNSQAAGSTQERTLLSLVRRAAQTRFGLDHGFSEIQSVADFQKRVPLRRYEAFWEQYWKSAYPRFDNLTWPGVVPFFALSSGTSSGTTKYIPITTEMVASNKKAGIDLLVHHVNNCPRSTIFDGSSFMLGGSTDLRHEAPGIWSGDLSGIAVKTLPWWAKLRYFPPAELALIKDWEKKIDTLARESLRHNIRMISGVPSWMLIFFKKLAEIAQKGDGRPGTVYPDLQMVVHGGVNFAPYYQQFKTLLDGSSAELREVYPASEGFIAVADRGYNEGLRVVLDHGVFFEFVPVEEIDSKQPTRHWIGDVQKDINYAVVLTTCAGLWSYVIGDTVKFVETTPPRLLVTGRISYYLSAFGEHLIEEEITDGVTRAAEKIGTTVSDYSVGPLYPEHGGELGGHVYVIEFSGTPPSDTDINQFATELDTILRARNEDYDGHRANGFGLNPPKIEVARPGTFTAWMRSRGKLGGQNKVPRIITQKELLSNLRTFSAEFRSNG